MAFSYPIDLHFPAIRRELLPKVVDNILNSLRQAHRIPGRFRELAAELIFEEYSAEWIDTAEFSVDYPSAGAAITRGKWLRLAFELRLAGGFYWAELYTFPIFGDPEGTGLQLNFEGRAYAAVYEFEPRTSGKFDDDVKHALSAVCYSVAVEAQVDAFIVLPDQGKLASVSTEEILDRLSRPQLELNGRRAGLITGVNQNLLSRDALDRVWHLGPDDLRSVTTTTGFTVLDLLQPFKDG